jgi:hypothetical protein
MLRANSAVVRPFDRLQSADLISEGRCFTGILLGPGRAVWHDHHDDPLQHCASGDVEKAVSFTRGPITEIQAGLALDRRRPVAFDMAGVFATN